MVETRKCQMPGRLALSSASQRCCSKMASSKCPAHLNPQKKGPEPSDAKKMEHVILVDWCWAWWQTRAMKPGVLMEELIAMLFNSHIIYIHILYHI